MSLPIFLLKRYLKVSQDKRFISTISIITSVGITLGVTVVIIALTILKGFENVVSDRIIELNSHLKVTSFGNRNLPNDPAIKSGIENNFRNQFINIDSFISKLAIIKSRKNSEGITLIGMSPENIYSTLGNFIQKDSIASSNLNLPKIYIGKRLSEKLFIKPGDTITIFSLHKNEIPTIENPPSIEQFSVAGIYKSGMSEYDDLNAYINFTDAERLFGMENEISGYNIRVQNVSKIDSLSEKLQDYLGYPYYVRSIFKVHQNIFTWLDLQKEPIPIILGLIIFVAVFNIIGTLLMIVLERTNSIGILRSLGLNRNKIIKLFIYHGFYLTMIGIFFGNLIAYILSILQKEFEIISLPDKIYFVTSVPVAIEFYNYFLVTMVTLLISFFASLIPAWIASKIKPISAIRFD